MKKLETVQRLAMKAILGSFRTTPTMALQIETDLPPPHLRLKSKILRYITRLQTLPANHPLTKWMERAKSNRHTELTHISNLEHLTRSFPEYTTACMEKIVPYIRPPWWIPSIATHIHPTKDEAKAYHDRTAHINLADPTTICIYTDGSGINGCIGAAAHSPTLAITIQQYLGTDKQYTVYCTELSAIHLAITMLENDTQKRNKCVIYSDSQAGIKAVVKPEKQSGQATLQA